MNNKIFENLFVLEMANNHDGSVEHGLKIIKKMAAVCKKYPMFQFAFKFQFRDLDTFIHPDYQNRKDITILRRVLPYNDFISTFFAGFKNNAPESIIKTGTANLEKLSRILFIYASPVIILIFP